MLSYLFPFLADYLLIRQASKLITDSVIIQEGKYALTFEELILFLLINGI